MSRTVIVASVLLLLAVTSAVRSDDSPLVHSSIPRALRVCADPNNLPFSNQRGEGFENELAELLAAELHTSLEYTWWAQRRGFLRSTLKAGECDAVLGVPEDLEPVLTTQPYYRSSYVFVQRERAKPLRSLDDPKLRRARIGIPVIGEDYGNPPPAHMLARRSIVRNVRGYSVYGDYGVESPTRALIDAVDRGEVDVAIAWGPVAGYFARQSRRRLHLSPVLPQRDGPFRCAFAIAIGVRPTDVAWRDRLDRALHAQRARIRELLREYGVPLL